MKSKLTWILVPIMGLIMSFSYAQEKTISGTVTDQMGLALPGVNILVEGTTNGTQTDFDGNYTIQGSEGQTLLFSYIGQMSVTKVIGATSTIDVVMQEDAQALEEVVVTALGISRDKKSLGYATQEVQGEDLNTVKSGNFVNALSGKASGIQIKKNNNLGGSTNVVIRGNASLTGSNQALFVIDGVPVNNTNTNSKYQGEASGNYYDYGNTASDINPDDIESVNVLKGAAASALYGSRAANGVIMITTKKGKDAQGIGVTVSSGITIGSIDKSTFAKYQNQYGAGYGPYYGPDEDDFYNMQDVTGDGVADLTVPFTEDASYGGRFDPNLLIYQWDALDPDSPNYRTATPWVNAKNGPITFFETPVTTTNSVSFARSYEDDGSFRLNYTQFDQSGLMPNSSIKKHNFSMSGSFKLTDRLTVTGYANYINTKALGRNSTGYSDNIVSNFKQWWQTNVDIKDLKDIYFNTKRNVTWNPASTDAGSAPIYWDNPYWTRYENYQNDSRNRFIGNVSLDYKFTDWLNFTARAATDTYSEIQEERRANGSVPTEFGIPDSAGNRGNVDSGYGRRNLEVTETNYDFMFNFQKDLSDQFNLKGILGTNIRRSEFQSIYSATSGGLSVPRLYSLQNSTGPLGLPVENDEKVGIDGIYASASLGYNSILFLDATIRRDHSSTLPEDNSTFYYPSVATSFVFTNLLNADFVTFGKLRANYAEVGNSAPFDYLYDTYNVNIPPGAPSTSVDNEKKNPNLKPEKTESFELGLEMKFLRNRLSFDLAYYQTNSVDQIFGVPVSRATGYEKKILNAGEIENKGVELSISGNPVRTDNFSWTAMVNWTKNKNEVVSLEDGIQTLQLGDFQGGVTLNAEVGQPYGVIYGTDYTYLNGERVVDPADGQYIKTSTSDQKIGDTNPDWLMGISNKFNYKNFSLSFLIDIQQGGSIFSLDQYYGLATGLYAETVFINDLGNPVRNTLADGGGFINEGVNPDGTTNTSRIRADRFGALGYRRGLPDKAFVYDASYVKLREVALTYNLPSKLLASTFLTNASLSVIGSNLWIIDKNLPHADPESGLSAGNLQGYSVGSLPTTRDLGVNLKLQF
ncbi:SusC/RagA family TonB-linked outer membrane protein [Arenibacter sp. M-2]|uniref:SusC/RagA family TonB-linked outer membrane protein n=1 Tax=unclassified Arenibacter TaxID=2615047 RepID=UPI000D773798|nr:MULTISPECIES: SusC/RagA family TonB-linked outer membrane protein [unclassified Arenibacter]MDL5514201.1 SusC/RagA family TonB-linked outer membrane protein [Arenibacter sp. M-2]PXX22524.1 TonB-linked SusC/RagA family outer membrane protein [Arenibacter sp. ARW7G5Y1]|tara:strand:+ start:10002 stop:13268 length:3267 start_codon:yes stop_codon:yes gene_type:complete